VPIKIKNFLTIYIIGLSISVMFYEKLFGQANFIYTLLFVTVLMIIGIWIFPEVVTKKTTTGNGDSKNIEKDSSNNN